MFEELRLQRRIEEEADFLPFISVEEEESEQLDAIPEEISVLALKNTVLFPNNVIPITVGRDKSIKAINQAYESGGRKVAVFSKKILTLKTPQMLISTRWAPWLISSSC